MLLTLGADVSFAQERCVDCFGSAFTSTAAAWGTVGYSYQADLLWQIENTSLGQWATLLYVLSAGAGIVGAAMGMPPKTYLWFFIGPGVFHWLVGATQPAGGVEWTVDGKPQGQRIVWRDAETGLRMSNLFQEGGQMQAYRDKAPTGGADGGRFRVSTAFLHVESLFSSTAESLISLTGAGHFNGQGGSDSNLARPDSPEGPWHIFSSLRWPILESMTGGQVRNPDLRDALVTFLSSECGSRFKQALDSSAYIAAGKAKGDYLHNTVFASDTSAQPGPARDPGTYKPFTDHLDTASIPTPPALVRMFEDKVSPTSFGKFVDQLDNGKPRQLGRHEYITCSDYLWTIVQGLRFEAGQAYWQMMRSVPSGVSGDNAIISFFHGWDIRETVGGDLAKPEGLHHFARNLIFAHLLRNELQLAPSLVDAKYAPAQQTRQFSETYTKTLGTKAKYGELIHWAFMMPHIQGVLLFLLIAAYPIAAMVVVVPGWHKVIFTWMAFFAWVKLWDVGFALVQVMEKSLWAMMGNNSNFAAVARRVLEMGAKYGTIGVSCPNGGGVNQHFSGNALAAAAGGLGAAAAPPVCAVAQVCARGTGNNTANLDCSGAGSVGDALMPATYGLLDQALTVASSANLDLSGSYYLYIMAALYFAIPAITGQVVLGAKAGTSSLVQGAVSAVAERAGNAAQQGYTGAMASFAASNSHSVAAAAYQGSLLKSGAALQALDAGNRKMDADRDNVFMSETAKGLSRMGQASELRARSAEVVRKFYDAAAPDKPYTGVRKTSENGATRVGRAPAEGDFSSYSSPGALMSTADGVRRVFGAVGGRLGYSGLSHAGNRLFTAAEEANRRYAHAVDIAGRVMNNESYMAGRRGVEANFRAQGYEANQAWDSAGARFLGEGMGVAQQRMGAFGRHQAELAAWEAKNRFASDAASQATILGMNPGSLAPGPKPLDHDGLAMSGQLGRSAQSAASYGYGSFLSESIGGANRLQGIYGTQAYSGMFQQSQGGHFIGFGPNHGFSLSPKFAGDLFTGIVSGAGKKDTYNGR